MHKDAATISRQNATAQTSIPKRCQAPCIFWCVCGSVYMHASRALTTFLVQSGLYKLERQWPPRRSMAVRAHARKICARAHAHLCVR